MLKKLISLFLFISMFSLQAEKAPQFLDFNNLIQETYYDKFSHSIDARLLVPNTIEILQSITDKLLQGRLILLFKKIYLRAMVGEVSVLVFYDNVQQIKLLKKCFYNFENGYLIAADIHKTEQEIKDIFNIKKSTIIYYQGFKEIARSTNFSINDISRHIDTSFAYVRSTAYKQSLRFCELKDLIHESYNANIQNMMDPIYGGLKIMPKNPIEQELTQLHFLVFLEALERCSTPGDITAVVFYDNANSIESLKNLFKEHKTAYLIAADINKTEQEIKNAFNITKPTILYYLKGKEVARSTNFDLKDVEHHIDYHLNAYIQQM